MLLPHQNSASILQGRDHNQKIVKCGVRGDIGPACNAAGMIDRMILGVILLYRRPIYARTQQCSINPQDYGPLPPDAPSWCQAPFDPEGCLRVKEGGKMANKHLFFLIATVYWAVTDELEVQSIQGLYRSLNSPTQLEHWKLEGAHPCRETWIGVQCSGSSIINLKLHGLGLTGNIGVELSHLKSLKHLNLAENKLGQSITYSFERMQHLRHLNLSHNFLTGPLDDVLNGLRNLKLMDLSFNSFTGELPTSFGSLTNLTGLFLENNQFTGSIIFLDNLSLCTGVNFTSMSVHDSPHMSAFSSSPMVTPSRLPPIRTRLLKVSRRKS